MPGCLGRQVAGADRRGASLASEAGGGVSRQASIQIDVDASNVESALAALRARRLAKPGPTQFFLDGLDGPLGLFRVHQARDAAPGANRVVLLLEPSERLLEFLAAG